MGNLKIKNDEELDAALKRLDELWDCHPSSERDVLVDDIEEYEDANFHIEPPTPDEAREFRMENLKSKFESKWCSRCDKNDTPELCDGCFTNERTTLEPSLFEPSVKYLESLIPTMERIIERHNIGDNKKSSMHE